MNVKKPRGTRDFAPEEMGKRAYAEEAMSVVAESYSYRKISVPTFEHAALFELKSGEEISEHMYVFEDKSGRRLCLRPEATASVCRMYAEELRDSRLPLRLYYSCPMFRYERPQKGRYREFWQFGVELIGPKSVDSDVETIQVAYDSLKKLGLSFDLQIGHMGIVRGLMQDLSIPGEVQEKIIAAVDKGESQVLESLVQEKVFLDLLGLSGKESVLGKAKKTLQGYVEANKALGELEDILGRLDFLGVEYSLDLGIARGLEYYTGMVFEVRVAGLGAQDQVCGGGRYDSLIELFSGVPLPAVGFAFGFDRVMNALEVQNIEFPDKRTDVVVAPVNDAVRPDAAKIASLLREKHVVDFDVMGRKLDKILKYAGDTGSRYVVIVGAKDLAEDSVTVRDMESGKQEKIKIKKLLDFLK